MELDELKAAWKAVEPKIKTLSQQENIILKRRSDIKTKLARRMLFAAIITFISLLLMATSRCWAPVKLSPPILIAICATLFIGSLAELYLVRSITRINLWQDTNAEVLHEVVKIKKTYKQMELWFSALTVLLVGWMTMNPPFVNTPRQLIAWTILAIAFGMEYIWYRKIIKTINELTTD